MDIFNVTPPPPKHHIISNHHYHHHHWYRDHNMHHNQALPDIGDCIDLRNEKHRLENEEERIDWLNR
jgi:hypothetical protein